MAIAESTKLERTADPVRRRASEIPRHLDDVERLALFVSALHGDEAMGLFDGLAEAPRRSARAIAARAFAVDSAARQARLAREFGGGPQAEARLKKLLLEAQPALRFAIALVVPRRFEELVRHLVDEERPAPPEPLLGFARRLVREAVR